MHRVTESFAFRFNLCRTLSECAEPRMAGPRAR